MIVILDTNIVISAVFFSQSLKPILINWANGKFTMAVTQEIAEEYIDVYDRLAAKYKPLAQDTFRSIVSKANYFEPTPLGQQVCEDPDDDMFLECALSSEADYLVTGDKLLLNVNHIGRTPIIRAHKFLEIIS